MGRGEACRGGYGERVTRARKIKVSGVIARGIDRLLGR